MADVATSDLTLPRRQGARPRAARVRRVRLGIYGLATAAWVLSFGLPVERIVVLGWLFGLLAVAVAADGSGRLGALARDWGLFAVLLVVYRYSAGLADSFDRPVLVDGLVSVDRSLGLGELPTVRLQGLVDQTGMAPWWQVPLSFVYVSHFFAVLVAAAALWLRDRPAWIAYTKRLLTLALLAVITYVLVPAAPPWMAAEQGLIAPIERSAFLGWERIGLDIAQPLVEQGRAVANPVAALPSMHAGFACFLAVFFWTRCRTRGRVLWASYAVAMAFTLVLTGEHWAIDVLLGWAYVAVAMAVWAVVDRRATTAPSPAPAALL